MAIEEISFSFRAKYSIMPSDLFTDDQINKLLYRDNFEIHKFEILIF